MAFFKCMHGHEIGSLCDECKEGVAQPVKAIRDAHFYRYRYLSGKLLRKDPYPRRQPPYRVPVTFSIDDEAESWREIQERLGLQTAGRIVRSPGPNIQQLRAIYEGDVSKMQVLEGFVILQQNANYNLTLLYMKDDERRPYPTQEEADGVARDLAQKNPGVRYYVAELTSASITERPVQTVVLRRHRE